MLITTMTGEALVLVGVKKLGYHTNCVPDRVKKLPLRHKHHLCHSLIWKM